MKIIHYGTLVRINPKNVIQVRKLPEFKLSPPQTPPQIYL